MNAVAPASQTSRYRTDAARWQAVRRRDTRADGSFVYAVRTTGVYCRPSCRVRLARRENIRFHATPAAAEQAGFRACKRCRPNAAERRHPHAAAIATACRAIAASAAQDESPPDLNALARAARLSPWHFHRVFKALTGVTPKAYAAAQRAHFVRATLPRSRSVTAALYEAGFRSQGRFYASAQDVLGMQPRAYRAGGKGEAIRYATARCALGMLLVAATGRGLCAIALGDDAPTLVRELRTRFPQAELAASDRAFARVVARVVASIARPAAGLDLPLDIQGTAFQQRVWRQLRKIPCGTTRSYAQLAVDLGQPTATRAVARACAANTLTLAIPCHRVVRSDGSLSGYRWGVERKAQLLRAERAAGK